ncbi:MAG: hypothetical protein AseanaTS_12270 [Candidatus Pelagadaptatus aseana]|uniref:DUF4389 domain-containing protein n=1 Tax=Candidatus Pelagadaptatus aseana TaxID=3120508 RepID=UPI0039B2E17E
MDKDTMLQHLIRLVFMLVYAFLLQVALMVLWPVVVVQFGFALFTGSDNEQVRGFAKSLGMFVRQTMDFLTYNTDEKPFPFEDWPTQ